jgi:hypothetical protein
MNPHASTQRAGRLLMALAAITGIILMAACGSNNSFVPPNPVGFGDGSLTGTYVFSSSGVDSISGAPINMAGAFAANGSGGVTAGGTMDVVDPNVAVDAGETITGGSYKVGSDGRGQVTLVSAAGSFTLDFVLTSNSHGLVTEFDSNGTGSGTIDLQTAVTSLSQLTGSYAFTLGGADAGGNAYATVGAFTLNTTTGTITAGVEDFNDNGSIVSNLTLSGSAAVGSGTGPGTITFTSSSQQYDFYPIDTTHLKFIETDGTDFLSGDAFTQTGASIPSSMVFTMSGGATSVVADAGVMTYNGTTFSGSEDLNSDGTIFTIPTFTGAAGATGVGGRVLVTLTDFVPANAWIVYPSSGGLLMLEADNSSVTLGTALAQQTGAAVAATQNYGFNLSAWNTTEFEENDIAQFLTTSTTFSGAVDINDDFGPDGGDQTSTQSLDGSYTVNSNGTGAVTTTANGQVYVSFNFYPASSDQFLVLETDSTQIGTGTFELQSAPSGSVAQSHMSLARPAILRPAVRARLAARRKK